MTSDEGMTPGPQHDEDLTDDDEDGGAFSFALQFAAAACPGCSRPGEPGPCPDCGAEVPPTDELSELTEARIQAVGPLADEAFALTARFDELPKGNVPLSNDQFNTAVIDTDLFGLVGEMATLGRDLEALDLNDPKVIGSDLRRLIRERLGRVRELLELCRELSFFAPEGPAAQLRTLAVETGRYGARLTQQYIRLVVSPTIIEARNGQRELQELLSSFPFQEGISRALAEMPDWVLRDVDSRVSLILDQPRRYTDDFGLLDAGRVFGVFADQPQPFLALAEAARNYFSHLLGPDPSDDIRTEALLILPAVALATLDRALVPHRVARQLHELLWDAWNVAPETVKELVQRTTAQGPLLFAAAARLERGLHLLAAGGESGLVDDETVLKTVMETYRGIAEASFRTYGWLVCDLARLVEKGSIDATDQPPSLGDLEQQLAASGRELAQVLAAASDSPLRNATAHEQYRWDAEAEGVQDLRTGQRWTLEQVERSVLGLIGAVIGADAGYSCFLAGGQIELAPPSWLATGEAPYANTILTEAVFATFGFRVVALTDLGATVAIEAPPEADKTRLLLPVAGISALLGDVDAFRVLSDDGAILLDVAGAAVREATGARQPVKDLAVLAPLLSDAERSGHDSAEALLRVLTVQVAQVVLTAIESVEAQDAGPRTALQVAERLGYVIEFARARADRKDASVRKLLERLGRARASAFAVRQGQPGAAERLGQQLSGLLHWAAARGIMWPPF
jgi:hypothetical protein